MPVVRWCSRHRTTSEGRCPLCSADRKAYTALHVSEQGKAFRLAVLERDQYICYWCGDYGNTLDYITPLSRGGIPYDPLNAVCACHPCNTRRGHETSAISNYEGKGGGVEP